MVKEKTERKNVKVASTAIVAEEAKIGAGSIVQDYAIIEKGVEIGKACRIGYHAVLREGTVLGDNSVFGTHSVSEGLNSIGHNTTIHSQCHITQGAKIGDWVFIAPGFIGANTKRIQHGRGYSLVKTGYEIGFGTRVGIGVIVLPGVKVGREALLGAGSLITRDIGDFKVAFGRPAREVGDVPADEKLPLGLK